MRAGSMTYAMGFLAVFALPASIERQPCPQGRTLERQLANADAVVLGAVIDGRDCPPPRRDLAGEWHLGCVGRQVDLKVREVWKGPAKVGHSIQLGIPPDDPVGAMSTGETHVIFARLADVHLSSDWFGWTDSCLLPEQSPSTDESLRKQLDAWRKARQS